MKQLVNVVDLEGSKATFYDTSTLEEFSVELETEDIQVLEEMIAEQEDVYVVYDYDNQTVTTADYEKELG